VQTAAAELRDNGVTVNALLPTTIDTPQVRSWYGDAEAHKWVDPRSLGSLLLWLASEPGRDVTGAIIPVVGRQNHPCLNGTARPMSKLNRSLNEGCGKNGNHGETKDVYR